MCTLLFVLCFSKGLLAEKITVGETVVDVGEGLTEEEKEKVILRVKKFRKKKSSSIHVDLSPISTEELINEAVNFDGRGPNGKAVFEELSKRPNETKGLVIKRSNQIDLGSQNQGVSEISIQLLARLPHLAGVVSDEFQIEMTIRHLFHPDPNSKSLDFNFIELGELLSLLEKSEYDETHVLDRLISEDRLKEGSLTEKKWRKALTKPNKRGEREPKNVNESKSPKVEIESGKSGKGETERSTPPFYYLVGVLAFLLGALAYWLVGKKRAQ